MFDQAMHHAMINQSLVLKNLVHNSMMDTMGNMLGMQGYKGPVYFHPETSADGSARGKAMASAGGNYAMSPYLPQTNLAQQFGTPQVTTSVASTLPLIDQLTSKMSFTVLKGFVPNPNMGMPKEFIGGTENPTSAGVEGTVQDPKQTLQARQPMGDQLSASAQQTPSIS